MKTHTFTAAAGATVLTALLILSAPSAASAVTPASDSGPTVTCEIGNVWSRLPADLRSDVRELREMDPGEERATAAAAIRDATLAGEYGPGVQKRAEQIKEHGLRSLARLWTAGNCG